MNSGYTLWGTLTTFPNSINGRYYPNEALEKAIKDYMKYLKKEERKKKLEKLNEKIKRNFC